jgi:hypothetical protein
MRGTAEKRRVSWLWWVSFWTSISINAEHPLAVESDATANWLPNRKRAVQVVCTLRSDDRFADGGE